MTLEDFFTLTEMKNGLASLMRVEELISMIQKQDCTTNNGSDAARQWSTVASTLASTENQDCLSHFIYLNGLYYLNQWLHEAVRCRQEVSESYELINVLLGSLEKLPLDLKKLSASGLLVTIEKLLVHESSDVKVRAQTLFERWNGKRIDDDSYEETEEACLNHVHSSKPSDDKHALDKNFDDPRGKNLVEEGSCRQESGINVLQSDNTEKLPVESSTVPSGTAFSSSPVSPESRVKDGDECITSPLKNDDDVDPEISTGMGDSYESGQRECGHGLSSTSPASSPARSRHGWSEPMETNNSCTSEGKMPMDEPTQTTCKEIDTFIFGDHSRTSKFNVTGESNKKLENELESAEFDALEVARLVAIEVEREVVDYREQSCSSSTDVSIGDMATSANHDSAEIKPDLQIIGEPNENLSVAGKDDSDTATSPKNDCFKFSEVTDGLKTEMQMSGSPGEKHKSCCQSMKLKCEFDLNADAFSENLDVTYYPIPSNPINLSAPIPISALKGAPGWAVTPLHFEGEAGWRGSAATSAFRPASPRRASDCEKAKHKGNLMEIDLNVADSESDIADVLKEVPLSYCNPSRDSSIEVSSGRAARIHLDLNSTGDEEVPSLQSSLLSHHHQKGNTSSSPTSSSSSMKASVRNFDLNDCPMVLDGITNTSISYGVRVNDPFFTIMGAKVPVERRDQTSQTQHAWMGSGFNWDAVMAGRPMMPYVHPAPPPGYAYNGLGMVPAFPFQPTFYTNSNLPHMAEARSSTIIPQLIGSNTHGPPVLSTQPFLMSISSTPSSSNGGEPANPGLDLNREAGSLKQFFMPGRGKLLEEQIKTASQHSTSGTPPLKRKEPDSGWEPYGYGYNQVTSWH